eukprot:COSAG01_NODE_69394_length_261_cov_1.000000_1_plen_64_part_10
MCNFAHYTYPLYTHVYSGGRRLAGERPQKWDPPVSRNRKVKYPSKSPPPLLGEAADFAGEKLTQ